MKNLSGFFQSLGVNNKNKVEPSILWNLKSYPTSYVPLIIQTQEGLSDSIEKKFKRIGCKNIMKFSIIEAFYVLAPIAALKEMLNMAPIIYISMNHKIFSFMDRTTEKLGSFQINQFGVTGRNITIAHLDTGIYPHADLTRPKNRIIHFQDFINNYSSTYDDHGHGTHCAGCMAGNGVLSKGQYKGIAPDAFLIGLKCLDEGGSGDIKRALQALQWVLDYKEKYNIRIVHIPFGVNYPYLMNLDPLVRAVERLWKEGLVVICAAGNSGPHKTSIASPGISKDVITVGCSTKDAKANISNAVCNFSSRGPTLSGLSKPDLVTPGKQITSLYCDTAFGPSSRGKAIKNVLETPYISFTGTSVSSSIVTGAVALLLEKYPHFTPDEVKLALEMSCNSLHLEKNIQGKGLLNIEKLLTESLV